MKKLLTTREVADILSCSRFVINNSRVTGVLLGHPAPEFIKFNYSVRYDREAIENWIEDNSTIVTVTKTTRSSTFKDVDVRTYNSIAKNKPI